MRVILVVMALWLGTMAEGFQVYAQSGSSTTLQSPEEFLGYKLGDRFTYHHKVVDYFEHVASVSDQVVVEQYGETYEGRPLITAYIASPENMSRLEEIRRNNLINTGMEEGVATENQAAIVWLGYNVHGNESVSMEAAMKTLYALLDVKHQAWLENTVIVMDPCLNPDGRERYAVWYNQTVGRLPNVKGEAREHYEPWPGGRTNHYLFDLNRDWAWMTQKETQARIQHYNQWMPHVHVDFHEQGVNSPYYFAPAAEPYHEAITNWQRELQGLIGENHAGYFDNSGWLYFTRQVFDLLYPGYGDSWPMFNGAIGMTYEQAGSGRAGLGIITAESDTLTLVDRIEHHHITGLSTVETTARNSEKVQAEFVNYYKNGNQTDYAYYVVKQPESPDLMPVFTDYLDKQGMKYEFATGDIDGRGYRYASGNEESFVAQAGDLLLKTDQPKATLLNVLFDPKPSLSDSLTYDMTSWALPYVYGLDAYAVKSPVRYARKRSNSDAAQAEPAKADGPAKPYAYLVKWDSFEDARFLAALWGKDIKLRYAEKPFEIEGHAYNAGTLIITRTGNHGLGNAFDSWVKQVADQYGQSLHPVKSGMVAKGADFGSSDVPFLKRPQVAALTGEPLSPYASGEVWHFFDQQLGYPVTMLNAKGFRASRLKDYDVLILPSGSYGSVLPAAELEALSNWVRQGGRLITMERAARFLEGKKGFALKRKKITPPDSVNHAERTYGDRSRRSITDDVPGAVYRVQLDTTHPLAFGYSGTYYTMKRSQDIYTYMEGSREWNVGVIPENGHLSGFVGSDVKPQLKEGMVIGVQQVGGGEVVYFADNPLFRGFWYNGRLLMANAIFMR